MSVLFDTLQYANRMKAVGMPTQQAEMQAELLKDVIEDQLVTRAHLDLRLFELKNDLIKWVLSTVLGTAIAQTAIIISCIRLIH